MHADPVPAGIAPRASEMLLGFDRSWTEPVFLPAEGKVELLYSH
jgi:hypothetical protein